MKTILSAANAVIAISSGFLVLLGYFFPSVFGQIGATLLEWAVFMAAFALLVGIFNLAGVHFKKVAERQRGAAYSAILLVSMLLPLLMVALDLNSGENGPVGFWSLWLFHSIQLPVEISLVALLAIVLVLMAARLLSRRPNAFTTIFLVTVVIVLLGSIPLFFFGEIAPLKTLRGFANLLALGGARGLLLGVALGVIATGLRVLVGADRPYGG